jgi:hypothetical protein
MPGHRMKRKISCNVWRVTRQEEGVTTFFSQRSKTGTLMTSEGQGREHRGTLATGGGLW